MAWLSRDLLKLRWKNKIHGHLRQSGVTWEDNSMRRLQRAAHHCREQICLDGAQLKLVSNVGGNKKDFLKYPT